MNTDKINEYVNQAVDSIVYFAPGLLLAIVVLWLGFWLVKKIIGFTEAALMRANLAPELRSFFGSLIGIVLKFVVVLAAAATMGFDLGVLVGVLAGVVFAVGLALQGFMGNFASGITIVFFKPYKVGDWVQIGDHFGKVESIQIFNTTMVTPGEKTLIIPNGKVTDDTVVNFSTKGHIRLDLDVTMPYAESFPKVKAIIIEALSSLDIILQEPKPIIGIETFDSHNVVLSIRPFIHPDNYWDATFKCNEVIKQAFSANNIKVAYSEGVELGDVGE